MIFLTSWIPVLTTFLLLLYFWSAKVSASGTSEEEEIDPKYVIIGVTLGAFLAIGFLALKICMIKRQLTDSDLVDSDNRVDKRSRVESAANREEVNL
ncbi:transmembrane protein 273 isoform X5 [Chelonia mydas]|uniref:transmembrane protein 273 isoform X5 n=1 Tax=Chelonia mydas TaxID=8469 RepID=UPI000FFC5BB6|nr:transmembrane protein 273 isoform X5 [Chelonia mydas]